MNQISKAMSASGAKKYYKEEYEHARGSYYTEKDEVKGRWSGKLADEFGLSGEVERAQFERLCDGQDPHTGEQLVKHRTAHRTTNKYGDVKVTSEHRAGWDNTFSAPKSVSIAALVGGDERIVEAHDKAVAVALKVIDEHTQARLGGNNPAETTGKALFALFRHDASRPDRKDGLAAPNLHTHVFQVNMTMTEVGQIKPLQPLETYRTVKLSTAVYRAVLAEELQKLGYEIRIDKGTGAPEIAGISRAYIDRMSPRRNEIKKAAEVERVKGNLKGIVREDGTTSTRTVARQNRRSKVYDREAMRELHQQIDREEFGGQAHTVVREARAQEQKMKALLWDERGSKQRAQEAVTYAIEKGSEREAIGDTRALMIDALSRHLGATTLEDVSAEMQRRHERGELIGIVQTEAARRQVTTEKALQQERENVETMRAGQGKEQPISQLLPKRLITPQGVTLNESQRNAVAQIVTSRDRVQALQGGAGTGKTTALAVIKEQFERAGYEVKGFAPTTAATQKLAESGIESKTLAKFIRQRQDPEAGKKLLILDESSLASTRQLNAFLNKAQPQDRILLVGDVRQHEGVEAGSSFAQLQKHGMKTVRLEKIVRQRDEPLRRVVEKLAVGEVKSAVDDLQRQGRITEVSDAQERLQTIAHDYAEKPEGTLVISPANKEREELNRLIHDERRASGQIDATEHTTRILKNRTELTGAERTFAGAYNVGDIIRYSNRSKNFGVEAGEYARVESVNRKGNMLTVSFGSTRESDSTPRRMSYDPKRLSGVSVYREAEIKVSEGERIQVRAPMPKQRITNGELGTIEKIEGDKWTVKLDGGRRVSFPVSQNPHVDYGYAVTSHSAQGQTVERVIVNMDTRESDKLLNQRMAYVVASRMRSDVRIYTNSTDELSAALARQVNKSTALEATQRLSQATSQRGRTNEQGRTTRTPGTHQTEESHAARATIERTFNAFDRERIRRPIKRAVPDAGAVGRASEIESQRGVGERADRVAVRGRDARSGDVRVAAEPSADGRASNEGRAEERTVKGGRGRSIEARSERSGEHQIRTEPARPATLGAGREERHAAHQTARLDDSEKPTTAIRAANRTGSGRTSGRVGNSRAPVAGSQLLRHRASELPAEIRSGLPTTAPGERADLRTGRIRHDGERDENRALLHRHTSNRVNSLHPSAPDVAALLDERRSSRDVGSDANDNRDLRAGIEVVSSNSADRRNIIDWNSDDILHRPSNGAGTAGLGSESARTLNESAPLSLTDQVKTIFDRPNEIARMATEFVRLANENRAATIESEISQPVQDFMHDNLLKSAQRPPAEQQIERDRQIAQQIGHAEPQHDNALQSSLYAAQFAPDRSELLNDFAVKTEADFARQQQQRTLTHEPEESIDLHSLQESHDDDFSIEM